MIPRHLILSVVLALTPVSVASQATESPTPERFHLVSAEDGKRLERGLRSAAEKGYRVIDADQGVSVDGRPRIAVLMERADRSTAHEYRTLACSGSLKDEDTRKALDELGSEGFRLLPRGIIARKLEDSWLPDSAYQERMVLILERDPEGRPWVHDAVTFGKYETFYEDLTDRRRKGFTVVGLWNSNRALQVVLQKPKDGPPEEEVPDHRLLFTATRTELRIKLERAAGEGYRIMAGEDPPVVGPPILLMQRVEDPGNTIDYKFVDDLPQRARKDKLEKKLNKRAMRGFLVVREGITREAIPVQRHPTSLVAVASPTAHYMMLSSRRAPGLPRALEDAMKDGYTLVRMFVEPDETTVLVEKLHN